MFIRLEKSSGIPITRQILDQIRTKCVTGALQPGDQLPSVRQLAHDLAVNQNTVLRVYERLEEEGWLEKRHGSGSYIAGKSTVKSLFQEREKLRLEAEMLVQHAAALGLAMDDIWQMLEESLAKLQPLAGAGRTKR